MGRLVNSKAKGKRGELEVAKLLRDYGFEARRGQQFSGSPDSPDVVHNIEGYHVEVKFTERLNLYAALEQAENDGDIQETPVVFHKRKHKPWVVIIFAHDFMEMLSETRSES